MRNRYILNSAMLTFAVTILILSCTGTVGTKDATDSRAYNAPYSGKYNNRVAFPIGGIGTGMICLEGTGAISHVSVRNVMDFYNEPCMFAALSVKGDANIARVLEGPVPEWKVFGQKLTGNGAAGTSFGLPRFDDSEFSARFPFGTVKLTDSDMPVDVAITGWNPFIPGDADNACLPVGALEYTFTNTSGSSVDAVFSYNSKNFMADAASLHFSEGEKSGDTVLPMKNGFILWQEGTEENPELGGGFAIYVDDDNVVVDHCWFKGGWWDPMTMTWNNIRDAKLVDTPPKDVSCPGASLFLPLTLSPGEEKTVRLMVAWYVPCSTHRIGTDIEGAKMCAPGECEDGECAPGTFVPWYAGRFESITALTEYWRLSYDTLRDKTALFTDTFYDTTLPDEVVEAVAANLTILKSPTVLRQTNGRFWSFEGCGDDWGCCHGSCTHVWNYAQAVPHLFPELERSLRVTEFNESQDGRGHQVFRAALPIREQVHDFHSASDGQLGGIMKLYREWRISGDTAWLNSLWPQAKSSIDYCIRTWDPKGKGVLEEPHHNTYDIEFWGPDGMCTSFYLGALAAAVEMGTALDDDVSRYASLLSKGREYLETELYNGEYFYQQVKWEGLEADDPIEASRESWSSEYSPEAIELLKKEGPKYQYGTGCISDGVLGFWLARMSGLGEIVDAAKVKSSLKAIHTYNLRDDLSGHANPQRPSFAMGDDGGLLLCSWPNGGKPSLPFVYSDEVWTGIEYQVASHLMLEGMVEEGLEIVRTCRDRYDGSVRNPFNEYECGHWYARAMASYGLIQGLTGVRYDAVDKTLYIDSQVGDSFRSFLATDSGFGTVGLKNGKPFVDMKMGTLDVEKVLVSGQTAAL